MTDKLFNTREAWRFCSSVTKTSQNWIEGIKNDDGESADVTLMYKLPKKFGENQSNTPLVMAFAQVGDRIASVAYFIELNGDVTTYGNGVPQVVGNINEEPGFLAAIRVCANGIKSLAEDSLKPDYIREPVVITTLSGPEEPALPAVAPILALVSNTVQENHNIPRFLMAG